jgi:hypothetical protein
MDPRGGRRQGTGYIWGGEEEDRAGSINYRYIWGRRKERTDRFSDY